MNKAMYQAIEAYMLDHMDANDTAHGREHVYRVLYMALDIADSEPETDLDILIAACLLHDVGREAQHKNPALCHAEVGSEMACTFLQSIGWPEECAKAVRHAVLTHRFCAAHPPESTEAKILFDADKLDVAGAIGIARTLIYRAQVAEPLYTVQADGSISSGEQDQTPSFFYEYHYKLKGLYDNFYTGRGTELAKGRQGAATAFYEALLSEVQSSYEGGARRLRDHIT